MPRTPSLLWFLLFLIILLPSTAGRFVFDLAGGILIFFLVSPIILAGIGWLGWKIVQSRIETCEVCGVSSFKSSDQAQCPICGSKFKNKTNQKQSINFDQTTPASSVTIDVIPQESKLDD